MAALLAFPGVPAVFVCHDLHAWHDRAPLHPRIYRYLAVSGAHLERLVSDGVPAAKTAIVPNFVDLERFQSRPPLPPFPSRVLVFGNKVPWGPYLSILAEACDHLNIDLDGAGQTVDRTVPCPERLFGEYDLVFAKGKSALEAAAVGAAVIVYGPRGIGPLVTASRFEAVRHLNFGTRLMTEPHSVAVLQNLIRQYDAADAAKVQALVRGQAGLDQAVRRLIEVYEQVIAVPTQTDPELAIEESRCVMAYVPGLIYRNRRRMEELDAGLASHDKRLALLETPVPLRARSAVGRIPLIGSRLRGLKQALSNWQTGDESPVVSLSAWLKSSCESATRD